MTTPSNARAIEVLRRGALVDTANRRFHVMGVHEPALNLVSDAGAVWSIVTSADNMTAYSLQVATAFWRAPGTGRGAHPGAWKATGQGVWPTASGSSEAGTKATSVPIRPGDEAHAAHGVLQVGGAVLAYADAPRWDGRLPVPGIVSDAAVSAVLELLRARPEGFAALLTEPPEDQGASLREDACDHVPEKPQDDVFVRRAREILQSGRLEELVGLGIGLTPAGDDFLCGVLAVEVMTGSEAAAIHEVHIGRGARTSDRLVDRDRLGQRLSGTTPPGRALLSAALEGHFPAYLLDMVARLDRPEQAHAVVDRARGHGATSGIDALSGLVWGLLQVSALGNRP